MKLYENKEACFGCGACAAICPTHAIHMVTDSEGFDYPLVDDGFCTECGNCRDVCPAKAELPVCPGSCYALRCREEKLLRASSSGGAFSLMANKVLSAGGLVCGACFDKEFRVVHRLLKDIAPMRKSKYVQSNLSGCYQAIQNALSQGIKVLFTGTPCQCHAMQRFFRGTTGCLHMASLLCRGVSSPGFWQEYVSYLQGNGSLGHFDFRDKRFGNNGHTVSYSIQGIETAVPMHENGFMRLYNLGLLSRPCCYRCPYTRSDNAFDVSMGDFWGGEKIFSQFSDGLGLSLVIIRSPWAEKVVAEMENAAEIYPCKMESALQPSLMEPVHIPLLRKFLFKDFTNKHNDRRSNMELIMKKFAQGKA